MSNQDPTTGVKLPHQLTEDEFRTWWESIQAEQAPVVRELPEVIYLGQETAAESS